MSDQSPARRRFLRTLGATGAVALFTPFDSAHDRPFDFAQDRPFDFAQDRPFDFAQDRRRGLFAEALALTPTASTTEGPFYPDKMPLDTDNDLLIINDAITPAVGEVSHLTGRVLTMTGQPVRNAFVEIWQVDSTASYVHTGGRQPTGYDQNFQGYGRFLTDAKGQYYFRTIKPISYTLIGIFRTAHIHVAISKNGKRVFTTQLLVKGHPDNARDGITKRIDPKLLETVMVDFTPMAGSKIGELTANIDIVLGKTLEELEDGRLGGGVAISEVQRRRKG